MAAFAPGAQNSTADSTFVPSATWPNDGEVMETSAVLRGSLKSVESAVAGCGTLGDSQASMLFVNRAGQDVQLKTSINWGSSSAGPSDDCPILFVLASQAPADARAKTSRVGISAAWKEAPSAVVGSWKDLSTVLGVVPQDGVAVVLFPWTAGTDGAKSRLGPDWEVSSA